MESWLDKAVSQLDRWVGRKGTESTSETVRLRLFAIACVTFFIVSIFNTITLFWAFGQFADQHITALSVTVATVCMFVTLRFTNNVKLLTWAFSLLTIAGIWLATYIDHSKQVGSFEIGAAYTPYMIATLTAVCLTGSRKSAFCFAALCIATLVAFFLIGSALNYAETASAMSKSGLIVRISSVVLALTIMLSAREVIYNTLESLEEAVTRANDAEAIRKDLIATMSHEIRTPLNGIISVSELLEKRDNDPTMQTHLNIISLSANNLLEIVNDTLGKARSDHLADIDPSEITVQNEPFSPRELIEQCCALFRAHAEQKSLWIGTHGLETLPDTIIGDAPHIRQVINNLVGNAIKFTNQGGVRLGARCFAKTDHTATLQFFVQDTGVGIEQDALERVFERFGQSMSAKTSHADGTGLGLAISNDLVTAMGGTLDVQSEVGVGTSFSFVLDLDRHNTASETAAA